jgi:hypothetical protein
MPTAFISYSWDNDAHKNWVRDLAARLRGDGLEVTLDRWHAQPGDQLPHFMEKSIRESDFVLIVCTPYYKERADRRAGGVGYEGDIITGEVFNGAEQRKFIPLLRAGDWAQAAPSWLAGKYYVDMRGDPYDEAMYGDLSTTVFNRRELPPPVGKRRTFLPTSAVVKGSPMPRTLNPDEPFIPIKIEGIVVDEVTLPRMDGTAGSALYKVPLKLSRTPPHEWSQYFVQAFDHPSEWTSMHRPGIASVSGQRVLLDGTSVDEIKKYHHKTLALATDVANSSYVKLVAGRKTTEQTERERQERLRQEIITAAKDINF